jgi:rhodanese-related sulfurtransferase
MAIMINMHRLLGLSAAVLGLGAAAADLRPGAPITELVEEIEAERDHISAPDLAERIMARDPALQVFDLRSPVEYAEFHIPTAKHITLNDLARQKFSRDSAIVLYSEGGGHSAQAWVLMRMRGFTNVSFLREGIYEWISRVREPRLAVDATLKERMEFERAVDLSRFFGGLPLSGVPRSEVPEGYWTDAPTELPQNKARQAIAGIRRRGC